MRARDLVLARTVRMIFAPHVSDIFISIVLSIFGDGA